MHHIFVLPPYTHPHSPFILHPGPPHSPTDTVLHFLVYFHNRRETFPLKAKNLLATLPNTQSRHQHQFSFFLIFFALFSAFFRVFIHRLLSWLFTESFWRYFHLLEFLLFVGIFCYFLRFYFYFWFVFSSSFTTFSLSLIFYHPRFFRFSP